MLSTIDFLVYLSIFSAFGSAGYLGYKNIKSNRLSHTPTEKKKPRIISKEEEKARVWQEKLIELGENPDFSLLLKEASYEVVPKECITYEAFMTKQEFSQILKCLGGNPSEDGFKGWTPFESLASGIEAKKLAFLIHKLDKSISLLENKEKSSGLTAEGKKRLNTLKKNKLKRNAELESHVEAWNGERKTQPKFSTVAYQDETELLKKIDQLVLEGESVFIAKRDIPIVMNNTSPALIELDEFLKENRLPEKVTRELEDTMRKIQEKLIVQKQENDDELILMNAKALNQSAKTYHGLN